MRHESFNYKLARAMVTVAPSECSFTLVSIGDVPLYERDDDANQAAAVTRLTHEIQGAQGLLFVTPVESCRCHWARRGQGRTH